MYRNGLLILATLLFSQLAYSQQLLKELAEGSSLREWADYYAKRSALERAEVEKYAKEHGLLIDSYLPNGKVMSIRRIDPDGKPIYVTTDNVEAANTISTSKVWSSLATSGYNLAGRGFTIGEWDGGSSRLTHQDYEGRCIQEDNSTMASSEHATHVGGTLIAGGVSPNAKGMANQAILKTHDWTNDNSEMTVFASEGGLVSNHSYGISCGWSDDGSTWQGSAATPEDYRFGYYNSDAQTWDNIAYLAPYYLICKSSGNANGAGPSNNFHPRNGPYDCISFDGNAKNILTVGAVSILNNGYSSAAGVQIADFSSTGPCDDGRIKPDIMGCGINVYSLSDGADDAYTSLQGTSMSSPNVAGSCLLLQEYYANTHNSKHMKSATLKGLVIHTADECGSALGPDYKFGWGLMNTLKAAGTIKEDKVTTLLREDTLTNQQIKEYTYTALGGKPLVTTVCWTDKRGIPPAATVDNPTPMLINDLDVRLIRVSTGDTTFPWKLNGSVPTAAATRGDNKVDNVEKIELASPVAGETYKIRITHKGTLSGPTANLPIQPYSLILSGIVAGDTSRTCIPYQSINSLSGRFDDGSGTTRKYAHNSDCQWLVNPADSAAKVRLILRNVQIDPSDTLLFYDGNSISAPILAKKTGTFNLDTIYSSGHQILVHFKSDASVNGNGWEIEYKGFNRPKFDISTTSTTSICAGTSANLIGLSRSTDTEGWVWTWQLPGANSTTAVGKNVTATYATPGSYPVTLTVTNLFGPASITKTGFLNVRPTSTTNVLPYTYGFENASFPNEGNADLDWSVSTDANTWTRTELAAYSGIASVRIRNNVNGSMVTRELRVPAVNVNTIPVSERYFSYRMAYARRNTTASSDQLIVSVSSNCGRNWAPRITRTNTSNPPLSTIGTTASDVISNFIPTSESQWRKDSASFGNLTTGLDYVLFKFDMTSDIGGFLYLDDIKIGSLILGTNGEWTRTNLAIEVIPNPATSESQISVYGFSGKTVNVELTDVLGKGLGTIVLSTDSDGRADIPLSVINNAGLKPGIYHLRATSGLYSVSKRIVVQ